MVSAPSAWYSCARKSHPELVPALALTGCLGLNEVAAGSGTWVPLSPSWESVFPFAESSCGDVGCCVSCLAPWHAVISCYCSDCDPSYRSTPKQSSAASASPLFPLHGHPQPWWGSLSGRREVPLSVYTSAELLRVPSRPLKLEGVSGEWPPHSPLPSLSFLLMHHCFLKRKKRSDLSQGEKSPGPCFKRLSHF